MNAAASLTLRPAAVGIYGHGPTPREQQIIDLWEAKVPQEEIAHALGVGGRYVAGVISRLCSFKDNSAEVRADLAYASQLMVAAIERAGRRFDDPAPPPVARPPIIADATPPVAWSRDPCPRCGVRGDVGCTHQRPFQEN